MEKNETMLESVKAILCEKIGDQIAKHLVVVKREDNGLFPYTEFRADIVWIDKNEREKK